MDLLLPLETGKSSMTTAETNPPTSSDLISVISGVASILLLVGVILGKTFDYEGIEEASILLFGFFGLGFAPMQLFVSNGHHSRRTRNPASGLTSVTLSLGLSFSIAIWVGWVLIQTSWWWLGTPLFIVLASAAVLLHINGLVRSIPRVMRSGFSRKFERFSLAALPTRWVLATCFIGFALCLGSSLTDLHLIPRLGGLPTSINPLWFVGLAILLLSCLISWFKQSNLLAVPVISLTVVLTGTPSIIYDLPRYSWTQKQIGLTAYFIQHGSLSPHTNFYDSWPGFIAGIAWLCHVGGVSNLEELARWWTPIIDVTAAIIVMCIARVTGVERKYAWLAVLLFITGNAVGQDYYSPQAAAYVGYLLLFAIAIRPQSDQRQSDEPFRIVYWVVLSLVAIALAVSHPLTPLVVSGMFLILCAFNVLRSRWMGVVPLIPTTIWTLLHLKDVQGYFNLHGVGQITANAQTQGSIHGYHYATYGQLGVKGEAAAAILVGILALVALAAVHDRISWALATCAGSTGLLVVLVHYGDEDLFRVALFALPLLAVLAARLEWLLSRVQARVIGILLPVITGAYIFGNMAFDYVNVVRPTDLSVLQEFERIAPPHSTLIVVGSGYLPIGSDTRVFPYSTVSFDLPTVAGNGASGAHHAAQKLTGAVGESRAGNNVYAYTYQAADAVWIDGGLYSGKGYQEFVSALDASKHWQVVRRTSTATLYKFRRNL